MNVDHLDCLFQEYGYDVKERTASYRVYLLNQGMYHGAEIQIMDDDIDATPILDRYSKLGYHAKQQRFKSIEQAESYLFKGFFNTQTTANDINRRYTEFAANQVKHYCNCGIKYQYISMPYSIYCQCIYTHIQQFNRKMIILQGFKLLPCDGVEASHSPYRLIPTLPIAVELVGGISQSVWRRGQFPTFLQHFSDLVFLHLYL